MTDTPTTERAQAAASTAADEGKHVAGVAQGEAAKVATEAKEQAKSLAGEARTQVTGQVNDQTRQQRDKLVSTLGTLGSDLEQMADNSSGGLAADVAREAANHARSLTSYLDGREPGELLDDVRDFARRRPGVFLAGALVAGIVAGRMARGVKDADSGPSSSGAPGATGGTTTGYGDQTTGYGTQTGFATDVPGYSTGPAVTPDPTPYTPATSTERNDPAGDPLSSFPTSPPPPAPPAYDPAPTQSFDPLGDETPSTYGDRPYPGSPS